MGQAGNPEESRAVRDAQFGERPLHSFSGLALVPTKDFLCVLQGCLVDGFQVFGLHGIQDVEVHIPFPRRTQAASERLEPPQVALEAGIDGRIHEFEDRPDATGSHAHIMEAGCVCLPACDSREFQQSAEPRLEGAMQENRECRRVHASILGSIEGKAGFQWGRWRTFGVK
jgi:hypothetical protein